MLAITGTSRDAVSVSRFHNAATAGSMPGSEVLSPTKSQKSAPAVMMRAELEAIEVSPGRKQQRERPQGSSGRGGIEVAFTAHLAQKL